MLRLHSPADKGKHLRIGLHVSFSVQFERSLRGTELCCDAIGSHSPQTHCTLTAGVVLAEQAAGLPTTAAPARGGKGCTAQLSNGRL